MRTHLSMKRHLWERLLLDVESRIPEEACGLLAGLGSKVLEIIPIENIYHSPHRYRMNPEAQLSAFQYLEEQGWEMLAIYHSHPEGPAQPSNTDIEEAYYPEAVYIILSPDDGNFSPRGYIIIEGAVQEIPIRIEG